MSLTLPTLTWGRRRATPGVSLLPDMEACAWQGERSEPVLSPEPWPWRCIASGCGDSKEDSDVRRPRQRWRHRRRASSSRSDCGQLEYDADAPSGGTFTDYAYLSDSGTNTSFDPGVVQTLDESQITTALFDGLTDFDFTEKCAPELKGAVAEKWEANDDATEFTFTIKDDQMFSNGEPVLPSSFKRLGADRLGRARLAYGYLIGYVEGGDKLLDGTVDDARLDRGRRRRHDPQGHAVAPNADFPSIVEPPVLLAGRQGRLREDRQHHRLGRPRASPIGNGPFKLESRQRPGGRPRAERRVGRQRLRRHRGRSSTS